MSGLPGQLCSLPAQHGTCTAGSGAGAASGITGIGAATTSGGGGGGLHPFAAQPPPPASGTNHDAELALALQHAMYEEEVGGGGGGGGGGGVAPHLTNPAGGPGLYPVGHPHGSARMAFGGACTVVGVVVCVCVCVWPPVLALGPGMVAELLLMQDKRAWRVVACCAL